MSNTDFWRTFWRLLLIIAACNALWAADDTKTRTVMWKHQPTVTNPRCDQIDGRIYNYNSNGSVAFGTETMSLCELSVYDAVYVDKLLDDLRLEVLQEVRKVPDSVKTAIKDSVLADLRAAQAPESVASAVSDKKSSANSGPRTVNLSVAIVASSCLFLVGVVIGIFGPRLI
jgi:hypothetical protein